MRLGIIYFFLIYLVQSIVSANLSLTINDDFAFIEWVRSFIYVDYWGF